MESFELIDIRAIIPECNHLNVCILVVRLGTFIGKDDDLMKIEEKKRKNTRTLLCVV